MDSGADLGVGRDWLQFVTGPPRFGKWSLDISQLHPEVRQSRSSTTVRQIIVRSLLSDLALRLRHRRQSCKTFWVSYRTDVGKSRPKSANSFCGTILLRKHASDSQLTPCCYVGPGLPFPCRPRVQSTLFVIHS